MQDELRELVSSVKFYMELEKECGMGVFYSAPDSARVSKPLPGSASGSSLDHLRQEVLKCAKCGLAKTRHNVVFGAGNACAELVFVGEAPGADEDLQGLPFVGRAGQLLTKIIEAMGLKRSDVYIANILKCRPPNNRPPAPDEIMACADNVRRQIEMIKPKVICTLGKFASQTLLGTQEPISTLRGVFHEYNGIKVMPTFHPAYLLRNPADKKLVWNDMQKIMREIKN